MTLRAEQTRPPELRLSPDENRTSRTGAGSGPEEWAGDDIPDHDPPGSPRLRTFAHLTVPKAALYRQVMRVFLAAKERLAVHLRPEDVHAAMEARSRPADVEPVVEGTGRSGHLGEICGPIRTPHG
jgi:hypothetical protein